MSLQSDIPSFQISELVGHLRDIRQDSLKNRGHQKPPRLPSKKILQKIIEQISSALFPNRLGPTELTDSSIDYYVGSILDSVFLHLSQQIEFELSFSRELNRVPHLQNLPTETDLAAQFLGQLPSIRQVLDTDLKAAFEGDPAAQSLDEVLVCYPGMVAVIHHRLAHCLYKLGLPLIARMIAELAHSATGIDIHPGAEIGGSFFIDHGTGVVIGETCIIGEHVRIYQAVTLGAKRFNKDENGALIKGNLRHPIVEDNVVIYAGATILGRITIGKGSTIGGNVWLTHAVPPYSQINQAQPKQELFDAGAGI
jgi:serine O-acetyltransferase